MASSNEDKRKTFLARLREHAERYKEMVNYMKEDAKLGDELSMDERNLWSAVYENVVDVEPASWCIISRTEQREEIICKYCQKIEKELELVHQDMPDPDLICKAESGESKVFYHKMERDRFSNLEKYQNPMSRLFDDDQGLMSASELSTTLHRRHRRGRRSRKLDQDFFVRDVIFPAKGDSENGLCSAQLDTFCQLPCPVMSLDALKRMGREGEMSTNFRRPDCVGIGGNRIEFTGIVRNMQLRLKGTAKILRLDILIAEKLNDVVDLVLNANFIQRYFSLIFSKMTSIFGGWFSKKKQSEEEKTQAESRRMEAEELAKELEQRRKQKEVEANQHAAQNMAASITCS